MIVRCFPMGGLVHRVNIEIVISELQDLINEAKHAIETSDNPEQFKQIGKLASHLAEYYERSR